MAKLRLVIVDDHVVVRQGLKGFLSLSDEFDIVGEGENGLDAVRLVETVRPDVLLLDLMMPKMDGIEATKEIRKTNPDVKILILSSFGERNQVVPAVQAGVSGYVLKDIDPEELIAALKDAYAGKTPLNPDVAGKLMEQVQGPGGVSDGYGSLSDREKDVFKLIARGMSNKEIAAELFISLVTVKTHVSRIFSKLSLEDRTQVAIFALKNGLAEDR
jgi:DNA-binding NarL/FixJ family response regulator